MIFISGRVAHVNIQCDADKHANFKRLFRRGQRTRTYADGVNALDDNTLCVIPYCIIASEQNTPGLSSALTVISCETEGLIGAKL